MTNLINDYPRDGWDKVRGSFENYVKNKDKPHEWKPSTALDRAIARGQSDILENLSRIIPDKKDIIKSINNNQTKLVEEMLEIVSKKLNDYKIGTELRIYLPDNLYIITNNNIDLVEEILKQKWWKAKIIKISDQRDWKSIEIVIS